MILRKEFSSSGFFFSLQIELNHLNCIKNGLCAFSIQDSIANRNVMPRHTAQRLLINCKLCFDCLAIDCISSHVRMQLYSECIRKVWDIVKGYSINLWIVLRHNRFVHLFFCFKAAFVCLHIKSIYILIDIHILIVSECHSILSQMHAIKSVHIEMHSNEFHIVHQCNLSHKKLEPSILRSKNSNESRCMDNMKNNIRIPW